jgi:hypothetical protein
LDVAKGILTTKNSRRRLRNRSVRSISEKFPKSAWWLTQMIPMGREADRVGGEAGPLSGQLRGQARMMRTRYAHVLVQGQNRDRHGEDAVAECL